MTRSTVGGRRPARLRQVAAIVRDLGAAMDDIGSLLGVEVAYRDPDSTRYGLANAIFPIGDTFLELVTPQRVGTTAERFLRRRAGDAGYMVCLQTSEPVAQLDGLGARVIEDIQYEGGRTLHLHPKDVGGAILSLDVCPSADLWLWAGPLWREYVRTDVSVGIVGAELLGADPESMAWCWGRAIGSEPVRRSGGWTLSLDRGELRFAPAEGGASGFAAIDVAVRDPDEVRTRARRRNCLGPSGDVEVCGLRLRLVVAA